MENLGIRERNAEIQISANILELWDIGKTMLNLSYT
jgi:hypothetical protein